MLPVLAALPMLLAQPGQSTHGPTEVCPAPWPRGPAGEDQHGDVPPLAALVVQTGPRRPLLAFLPAPLPRQRCTRGNTVVSFPGGREHLGLEEGPGCPTQAPCACRGPLPCSRRWGGGSRRGALWGLHGYRDQGLTSCRWPETGAGWVTNSPCSVETRNGAGWWWEAAPAGWGERRAPWPRGQSFLSRQLQISLLLHPFSQPKLMGRSMHHGRPP